MRPISLRLMATKTKGSLALCLPLQIFKIRDRPVVDKSIFEGLFQPKSSKKQITFELHVLGRKRGVFQFGNNEENFETVQVLF